jgi:hypothetical protein
VRDTVNAALRVVVIVGVLGLAPGCWCAVGAFRERLVGRAVAGFVLGVGGGVAAAVSLFALMFQGYVEDAGSTPSQTWPVALGAIVVSGVFLYAGRQVGQPGPRLGLPAALAVLGVVLSVVIWVLVTSP